MQINKVTKTISFITIIALISKVLGLLREVGIASIFGIGLETDAFYLTIGIPALLFVSIGVAIQNLFIIEFSKVKKENDINKENYLTSNVSNILSVISIFIFIITFLFTPLIIEIIAPGFKEVEKFNLAVKLTRILLPTIVVIPLYQIKASVLKVYDKFVAVGIIDLSFNIFQIIYLIFFSKRFGIVGLTYAVTLSYLFQYLMITVITYIKGFRFKPVINFKDERFITIIRLFIPTFISFGIIQINETIDKMIASNLGDGAIGALNYGLMLRTVVFSIIVTSIITVVYPLLLKIKDNKEEFNKTLNNNFKLIILLMIPVTILMILFNKEIVNIIFLRGEFTSEDSKVTSMVLLSYLIGMPFYSIKTLLVHASYTYSDSKLPLLVTVVNAILNIVFSLLLKRYIGVYGIALGLSIADVISVTLMIILMIKKGYLKLRNERLDIIKIILVNIIIALLAFGIMNSVKLNGSNLVLLLYISGISLIFILLYLIILKIFRVQFINEIVKKITRKGWCYEISEIKT